MSTRLAEQLRALLRPRLPLLFVVLVVVPYPLARMLTSSDGSDLTGQWPLLLALASLGWLLGSLIDRQSTIALRRYRRAVRRLGRGDFGVSAEPVGSGEWRLLATQIDEAAENLAALRAHFEELLTEQEAESARLRAELSRMGQENMRLQMESLQRGKSVSSLQEFVVAINRMTDQPQIAGQLLTYLDSEVDYTIATVLLVDPETQRLDPVAISNREKGTRLVGKYVKDIQSLQPLGAKSAIGRVMTSGNALLIGNVEADRRGLASRPEIKSELVLPLKVQDKVIGVLHLEATRAEEYSQQHEAILALLANATATAIGNIRLFEEEAKVRVLREMDRVKSQLISTVSHELRTPLSSIKGYTSSLQRPQGKLDERTRLEFLQIIEEEADRLSEMIENLLDMSKIEAGVLKLHRQPMQIERIVRKVVEQARRRAPSFRFRVRLPSDLPMVAISPHRIEQVIHNLVENAIKYSPDAGRVNVSGELADGCVVISVADEGLGIAPEHHQRIFEPFFQVDSGTTRRVGGSGLGLAICRGFVEAHRGRIWVESHLGCGSTFRFTIPLVAEDNDAVSVVAAVAVADGG